MQKLKCRTAFNARDEEHKGIIFTSDSLCQQHFKDECDVNLIIDRYVKTGVMEHLADAPPHFADVSEIPTDLMASYDAIERAEAAFMDLPSSVRKSLDNDPRRLSEWLLNPDNRDAAIAAGLIVPSINTNVEANISSKEPQKNSEASGNKASGD